MNVPGEETRVVIIVERFRIVGYMHRYPGARLLDIVNAEDNVFLPLTDAEIYSLSDGKLLQKAGFVGINRDAIQFFYPVETKEGESA
ncbi:MAG: hypothetical protein PHP64_00360 [Actinomycetota bacterium]|nr:hypothetical protein [Actinomycetota bacterium]